MGFDSDFDDDFFDDDFFAEDSPQNEESANEDTPIEEIPGITRTAEGNPIKIMILYDGGSLKDLLVKYIAATEFEIVDAYDIASAKQAMQDNPDLDIIVANTTVAGVDVGSIIKQMLPYNPDLIIIICTDMIDQLTFVNLINTAQIYKILTFPLDVDKELIPAINEVTSTAMVRRVNREDWDELVNTNETLKKELKRLSHLANIQHGGMRLVYNYLSEILVDYVNELCKKVSQETRDKLIRFQKNVLDHFFLSLSPKNDSMDVFAKQLETKFAPQGSSKLVKLSFNTEELSSPLLKSKVAFLVWLLVYRLALYENDYFVSAEVTFKSTDMAFLQLTYRLENEVWGHMNSPGLQQSYTRVVEGLATKFMTEYRKDEDGDTICYSGNVIVEQEI